MPKYRTAGASYDASIDLDPERAWQIFQTANAGGIGQQSQLAREILEKDADIAQGWSVRSAALLGLEWELVGGLPEHRRHIYQVLRNARPEMGSGLTDFRGLLGYLELAAMHGFSSPQIVWRDGGAAIEGFECPPHAWFCVDTVRQIPYLKTEDGSGEIRPQDGRWILHRYGASAGSEIQRSGLVRPLGFLYAFKRLVNIAYLRYLEKFGMPVIAAKLPQRMDDEDSGMRQKVARMLDYWSSDGSIIHPDDLELSFQQPAQQSGNQYQDALSFMQSQAWRLLLGQDSTSSAANSSRATGEIHNAVRRDILIHDAQSIAETITAQLIPHIIGNAYGWDSAQSFPRFRFKTETSAEIQSQAAALQMTGQAAQSLGLVVSQSSLTVGGLTLAPAQATDVALATKIGVGGVQALVGIVADPVLSSQQKAGLLTLVFGVSPEEAQKALAGGIPAQPQPPPPEAPR